MEFTLTIAQGDNELSRSFVIDRQLIELDDETAIEEQTGKIARQLIEGFTNPNKPF